MSRGIEVSPKHGVNPVIPICFFCGEEKNEIALLGRIREKDRNGRAVRGSDLEAPRNVVLDYQSCECCREKFKEGVLLIGVVTNTPDGRPPIQKQGDTELFPTGSYAVMKSEAVNRVFNCDMKAGQTTLVDQSVLEHITNI